MVALPASSTSKTEWHTFSVENMTLFTQKAVAWANTHFDRVAFLKNNDFSYPSGGFANLLAIGEKAVIFPTENIFAQLKEFHVMHQDWLFGHLGYDVKNDLEKLESNLPDGIGFPMASFFVPEILMRFPSEFVVEIRAAKTMANSVFDEVNDWLLATVGNTSVTGIQAQMPEAEYLEKVKKIIAHIEEGDVYELNFCQAFFAEMHHFDTLSAFWKLNQLSPNPFAAYYKQADAVLMGASPERFLKKEGDHLISQPIKGTARRGATPFLDQENIKALLDSEKERAENLMIVDLVRNDLARSCVFGSVKVPELFGIYSFPQVHQMISTVTGKLRPDVHFTEAIANAFPMGSMTGAPKIKVMELVEKYELTKRGLYSGSIGYITPDGDFDFNVVIRSMQYNRSQNYLSWMVGSAITYDSYPQQEYQECLSKAKAIFQVLTD